MNLRECHLATLRLEPCPRTPRWELGFWSGAIQRWYQEGLTGTEQAMRCTESYGSWVSSGGIGVGLNGEHAREHDVSRYFGLDRGVACIDINYNTCPAYPSEVLDETEEFIIRRDGFGIVSRVHKPELGMPEWIDYPVHNRHEWETFQGRPLRSRPRSAACPATGMRCWQSTTARDYPLAVGGGATGYFGSVRQILGLERTLDLAARRPGLDARHVRLPRRFLRHPLRPGVDADQARPGRALGRHVLRRGAAHLAAHVPRVHAGAVQEAERGACAITGWTS